MVDKNLGKELRKFMDKNSITQETLSEKVGVSQASVCRALRTSCGKVGPAQEKIFIYAGLSEYIIPDIKDPKDLVLTAFHRSWNGTKAHAEMIAKVIDAMAEYSPYSSTNRMRSK